MFSSEEPEAVRGKENKEATILVCSLCIFWASVRLQNHLLFVVIQLLSRVWLFTTPGTEACQDSPSFIMSCLVLSNSIKKAEHWRIDAFELWCWRRLLRVPWTSRRSNKSVLKEINFDYSWEGLLLKLKLQYFGQLMWRADSLEKTLMPGKIEGRRRSRWKRMRGLNSIADSMDMNLSKLRETVEDRGAWHATVHGVTRSQTGLSSWRTATTLSISNNSLFPGRQFSASAILISILLQPIFSSTF